MKLKIFDITQVTEAGTEAWTSDKVVYHMLLNDSKMYVFYDLRSDI